MSVSTLRKDLPGHTLPRSSPEALEDALFHYTTATGLLGIFKSNQLWHTSYSCTNDESELEAGAGVLTPLFRNVMYSLRKDADRRISTFHARGVDPMEYADGFESQITSLASGFLSTFITCFCKPTDEEVFLHGLLSQWRGYGRDGGYAIQFSRKRLQAMVEAAGTAATLAYDLQDVHYSLENPFKAQLLSHSPSFESAFLSYLEELASDAVFSGKMKNPLTPIAGDPLEALLDYLVHTKSSHFREELECRLSLIYATNPDRKVPEIDFFNREGLIVPYAKSPKEHFDVLSCIDWIVVGPGPRLASRFKSAMMLARQSGRDILVRPSHIPFTRL